MKLGTALLIFSMVTLFHSISISQTSSIGPDSTHAKIYFIRRTGLNGFADLYSVFIDGKLVCELSNDRYSIHSLDSGEHIFVVQTEGKEPDERKSIPLKLILASGKKYFIQLDYDDSKALSKLYCFSVSEKKAKKLLKNCIKKPQCE